MDCWAKTGLIAAPTAFSARTCPGVANPSRSPKPAEVCNPKGAGVSQGSRIAIWAPNSPVWIVSALAILAAGGVVVPIDDLADAGLGDVVQFGLGAGGAAGDVDGVVDLEVAFRRGDRDSGLEAWGS